MAKPFPIRFFWISVLLLLTSCMLMAGELVWLGLVIIWSIVLTRRWWRRWFVSFPAAAAFAIFVTHAQGYKVYGSPIIGDNRPLFENPMRLIRLEEPNIAVTENGDKHPLAGVTLWPEAFVISTDDLERMFSGGRKEPILFIASEMEPSGFAAQKRIGYFCGNTFFPHLLARPLRSHEPNDLGDCLRRAHLAKDPLRPDGP